MGFCNGCGTQIEANVQFCNNCGAAIAQQVPGPAAQPVQAAPVVHSKRNLLIVGAVLAIVISIIAVFAITRGGGIVGGWETSQGGETVEFHFNRNGTGQLIIESDRWGTEIEQFNWSTSGRFLTMINIEDGDTIVFEYEVSGNHLIMTEDGWTEILRRIN